jgi:hypothetical protein
LIVHVFFKCIAKVMVFLQSCNSKRKRIRSKCLVFGISVSLCEKEKSRITTTLLLSLLDLNQGPSD